MYPGSLIPQFFSTFATVFVKQMLGKPERERSRDNGCGKSTNQEAKQKKHMVLSKSFTKVPLNVLDRNDVRVPAPREEGGRTRDILQEAVGHIHQDAEKALVRDAVDTYQETRYAARHRRFENVSAAQTHTRK